MGPLATGAARVMLLARRPFFCRRDFRTHFVVGVCLLRFVSVFLFAAFVCAAGAPFGTDSAMFCELPLPPRRASHPTAWRRAASQHLSGQEIAHH